MRKIFFILSLAAALFLFKPPHLFAGEIDILVNKLVEKRILTPSEAQTIVNETRKEVAKDIKEGKYSSLPDWVRNLKFKGDFRLRYQWNEKKGNKQRHRGRYRLRLGVETKVVDNLKVGFGLATGGSDPRSTNQTMYNTFETPDIRLDYAFAQYQPASWLILYGGKFKRKPVLWQTSDLLWDGDINPEGSAAHLEKRINSGLELFLNAGIFVLDEAKGETADPAMYFVQPGINWGITGSMSLKTALAYYAFSGIKGKALDHSSGTNTLDNNGHLIYDYNSINPGLELAFKRPLGGLVNYSSLFGEYVYNPDPSSKNKGYLVGLKFGDKKLKEKGQWQAKYMYRRLEKDAWLDTFPDSDFYGGKTGVKGHEVVFNYSFARRVILGLDYYHSENIDGTKKTETLLQADVVFKF